MKAAPETSRTTAEVIPFTSDRMKLLAPLVTARAVELARKRLLNHKARLSEVDDDVGTVRVARILLRELNPLIHLTNEELGILMGLNAETVGKLKSAGEL